jgi:hypothetical protein
LLPGGTLPSVDGHHPLDLDAEKRREVATKKRKATAEAIWEQELKTQMSTPLGRAFVNKVLEWTGVWGWERNPTAAGRREVGLMLHAELRRHCLAEYFQMLDENNEHHRHNGPGFREDSRS